VRFTVKAKDLKNALESSVLKGKYFSSAGLKSSGLSDYAIIVVSGTDGENDGSITIYNGNDATAVSINVDGEIDSYGECVIPVKKVAEYLKKMNDEVTISVGDLMVITEENTTVKIPVQDTHPTEGFIGFFRAKCDGYTIEDEEIVFGRDDTPYETVLDVSSEAFSSALSSCEITNSGVYKLDFNEGLTISSSNGIEAFITTIGSENVKSEEATAEFTAPIHRLFNKEMLRVCFNDNSPIFIIGDKAKIMRAPYVGD
jgi:hypothetical protein